MTLKTQELPDADQKPATEIIQQLASSDTASEQASARLKKPELFDRLKAQGCSVALSLQAIA